MPRSPRPPRVNLTLTEEVIAELQQWADQTGHNVTSLCTWLVKRSLATAKEEGEFKCKPNSLDLMRQFFDDVASGKYYSDKDLAKLATEVEIDPAHLIAHQNCFKKGGVKVGK